MPWYYIGMRIWDVPPQQLCRKHLLGEHRELHALWSIIQNNKSGYKHHPETKRWLGKLSALSIRHDNLVAEMKKRGYKHHTPLPVSPKDITTQNALLHSIDEQLEILKLKPCDCPIINYKDDNK